MASYDFTYYAAESAVAAPFIHSDGGSMHAVKNSRNIAARPKILSEITNQYSRMNALKSKSAGSQTAASQTAASQTAACKTAASQIAAYKTARYSMMIPMKVSTYIKPGYENANSFYSTNNATFWQHESETSNLHVVQGCIEHIDNAQIEMVDAHMFNAVLFGADMQTLIQTKYAFFSHYEKLCVKKITILKGFFNDYLIDAASCKINGKFTDGLEAISRYFNVEICLADAWEMYGDASAGTSAGTSAGAGASTLHPTNDFYLHILGGEAAASAAELRCKLLMDDLQGLYIDSMDTSLSMMNLMAGINKDNLNRVMEQTGVRVYMPDMMHVCAQFADYGNSNRVFFSGEEESQVMHAKQLVEQTLAGGVRDSLYCKDMRLDKLKLEYMVSHMEAALMDMMRCNGSYIQFPSMDSASEVVRIQATSEHLVEQTWREVMELQSRIYVLDVCSTLNRSVFESCDTLMVADNQNSVWKIVGLDSKVKKTLQSVDKAVGTFKCTIELLNGEREFICGKKNGKLLKIMNQTGTNIVFGSLNELSFLIHVTSHSTASLLRGVELLELEFPLEMSFYIPEIYHRQIIGVGGSLVQSIMRKYNVFIKFSNTFEFQQPLLSFHRYANVLVKCPNKNALSIPRVRRELQLLVLGCLDVSCVAFQLSASQHRLFLNCGHGSVVSDIERKTSCFIDFPLSFGSSDAYKRVEIKGIDTKSSIEAFKQLAPYIAKEITLSITLPISASFSVPKLLSHTNPGFLSRIVVPFRVFLATEIKIAARNQIILTFANLAASSAAIANLECFLNSYDLKIIKTETVDLSYSLVESKNKKNPVSNRYKSHFHSKSLTIHPNSFNQPLIKSKHLQSPSNNLQFAQTLSSPNKNLQFAQNLSSPNKNLQFSPVNLQNIPVNITPTKNYFPATREIFTAPPFKPNYNRSLAAPISPVELQFSAFSFNDHTSASNGGLLPPYDMSSS